MVDPSEQLEHLVRQYVLAPRPGEKPGMVAGAEELQRMAALRYVQG